MTARAPSSAIVTSTRPPSGVNLIALVTRLSRSARTGRGRPTAAAPAGLEDELDAGLLRRRPPGSTASEATRPTSTCARSSCSRPASTSATNSTSPTSRCRRLALRSTTSRNRAVLRGRAPRLVEHQLEVAVDRGQRRAQLVLTTSTNSSFSRSIWRSRSLVSRSWARTASRLGLVRGDDRRARSRRRSARSAAPPAGPRAPRSGTASCSLSFCSLRGHLVERDREVADLARVLLGQPHAEVALAQRPGGGRGPAHRRQHAVHDVHESTTASRPAFPAAPARRAAAPCRPSRRRAPVTFGRELALGGDERVDLARSSGPSRPARSVQGRQVGPRRAAAAERQRAGRVGSR